MYKNNIIPTVIKQPTRCCTNCGKGYKQKGALDKHLLLCELITRTKTKTKTNKLLIKEKEDAEEIIPNNKQMYHMILELTTKYNNLTKKMEEVSKYAIKEKKKINIVEWLNNNNSSVTNTFKEFSNNITFTLDTTKSSLIDLILNNSFNDILNEIFNHYMTITNDNANIPILAFIQKTNTLFVFNTNTNTNSNIDNTTNTQPTTITQTITQTTKSPQCCCCWTELSKDTLITFLISIQMKISKLLYEWKQKNKEELSSNEELSELCNKALIKIMTPEFKTDKYYTKAKTLMYNTLKKDIKMFIDYEFE